MDFDENIVFIRIGENDYNQRIRELDCHYRKRMKNGDWRLYTGERLVYMWDYDKDCAAIRIKVHCSAMKEFSEFLYYYLYEIADEFEQDGLDRTHKWKRYWLMSSPTAVAKK